MLVVGLVDLGWSEFADRRVPAYNITCTLLVPADHYFLAIDQQNSLFELFDNNQICRALCFVLEERSLDCPYVTRIVNRNEVAFAIAGQHKYFITNDLELLDDVLLLVEGGQFLVDFLLPIVRHVAFRQS